MLNITLLGEQAVVDAATGEVRTRASRTIALLACLAAHAGSPQSRTHIAGTFWPESGDAQALTNLRRELHQLRQVLGDATGSLEVTSTHLCWTPDPGCRVDLVDFLRERAEAERHAKAGHDDPALRHGLAALERYGGELLPGMSEEWVLDLRAQLARACVATCDLVCDAALRTGRPAAAVPVARRRVAVAPLEESGYRKLMELQALVGDRADAITTYHRCASVLEQELGVDPDPATTELLDRIMGRSPGPATRQGPAHRRPRQPGLVARQQETARLTRAWRNVLRGRGGVVLLRGPAGVGKSRLVSELVSSVAAEGAVVATGECFEASGRLSLAPVAQWVRNPAVASARAGLDPVWGAEVDRLVPSPASEAAGRPAPDGVDVWQRHRFFEGLARCVLAVSRPTLLVLDNLQWCDEDSLTFCSMLLNLAGRAPVLLVATLRSEDATDGDAATRWLAQVRDAGRLTSIAVEPFDDAETADLARVLTGTTLDPESVSLLQAATGGYPLYVVEAVRSARNLTSALAQSEPTLSEILRLRLGRSSPAARAVAGLAAAVGRDFELALLTEASDLEPDTVVLAVDELWAQRIVRERRGAYAFTHDRLREAAYGLVSPARRWLLHRRIAQALELLHAGHTDEVAAHIAAQYSAAGNRERALGYYRQAAQVATGVFAHAEAVGHHRTTVSLLREAPQTRDRDELELACLEAMIPPLNALYGYASPELEQVCRRTIELAEGLGRRDQRLTAMVALWASWFVQGRMSASYDLARQIADLVGPGGALLGQAHFSVGGSALHLGRLDESRAHFATALSSMSEESLSVGTRARVHTAAWAAHAEWACGQPETARELMTGAVEEARDSGHLYSLAVALAYAGITGQLLGDRAAVQARASELRALCERCGFAYYGEWGLVLDGWSTGGDRGEALARRGVANLRSQGALARQPYWLSLLAETVAGDDGRRAVLDEALAAAEQQQERWWVPELLRQRARYDPEPAGRLADALALAHRQGSVALAERCATELASLDPSGERTLRERLPS